MKKEKFRDIEPPAQGSWSQSLHLSHVSVWPQGAFIVYTHKYFYKNKIITSASEVMHAFKEFLIKFCNNYIC